MTQNGKGLAALALIIALLGAGAGGFLIIKQLTSMPPEEEPYIRPMAKVYRTGSYFLPSGTYTTFNFTDKIYDSHDAFVLELDVYEIPETGFYLVIAQYSVDVELDDFFKIDLALNGTTITSKSYTPARDTNTFTVSVTDIINVTAGDLISIRTYSYNLPGDPRYIYAYEAYTFFEIMKM